MSYADFVSGYISVRWKMRRFDGGAPSLEAEDRADFFRGVNYAATHDRMLPSVDWAATRDSLDDKEPKE